MNSSACNLHNGVMTNTVFFTGELLCFFIFSDLLMLLQCCILVLNKATVSYNEVHTFGSEPCRLFQLALHAVFQEVFLFLHSAVTLTNECWTALCGMPALCTQPCACCLLCSSQIQLCAALCFRDYCQHFVWFGSKKVFVCLFAFA